MKIKEMYTLKEIPSNYAIFPIQRDIRNKRVLLTLNESGALLWQCLKQETTEDELVSVLMSHYDVDEAVARRDVKIFVRELVDSKIIVNFP